MLYRGLGAVSRVIRLDGFTGRRNGGASSGWAPWWGQVLDLEGLARHRGSILADVLRATQPRRRESKVRFPAVLGRAGPPTARFLVEAESARIGALAPARLRCGWPCGMLPGSCWRPRSEAAGAGFLAAQYAGLVADREWTRAGRLNGRRPMRRSCHGRGWIGLLVRGRQPLTLPRGLIEAHNDRGLCPAAPARGCRPRWPLLLDAGASGPPGRALDSTARASAGGDAGFLQNPGGALQGSHGPRKSGARHPCIGCRKSLSRLLPRPLPLPGRIR